MRWDDLFRDLEAQLEAAAAAELDAEVADRTRREAAQLALVDRARAAVGHPVTLRVLGAGPVDGLLADVGAQWLLLAEPSGRQALRAAECACCRWRGCAPGRSVPGEGGQVFARLGLGSALRGIARDRLPVQVVLTDGSVLAGTLDRVGSDFVELTEHGEVRRRGEVTGVRTVPFAALALLRSGALIRAPAPLLLLVVGSGRPVVVAGLVVGPPEPVGRHELAGSGRTSGRCRPPARRPPPATVPGHRS